MSSNQVTVSGINSAAAISITGGEYSIGGGAFTSAAGTVSNNQTVTVRVNSSGAFSTQSSATLTIGGVSAVFTVTTVAADTTPDAFQFQNNVNTALGVLVASNSVTIAGLNTSSPVTIAGGEYSIAGGAFTSAAGTLSNNQSIQVRVTSSGQFSTPATATLSVGGVSATFTATTLAADLVPDAFQFQGSTNTARGVWISSNAVTISGLNTSSPVTIAGGEYSIGGGAFTSAAGSLTNGQSVRVRVTSSSQFSTAANATLNIGGVSAMFTATTLDADTNPDAFQFQAVADVVRTQVVTSNEATITGINTDAPVTITGGEYSIEGGAFTSAAGSIAENQRVRVRATSSGQFSTAVNAVLRIGAVSGTFTVTTYPEDTTPDAFQFQRVTDAVRDAWVVSNLVTITGINNTTPVSIQNGEFSVAGGAYRSAAGTVEPGQSLRVRARASSVYSKSTRARVTVGGVPAEFEVVTELPTYVPDDVEFDGTDVVYLLNSANRLVFRWSLVDEEYLDPYELSQSLDSPTQMVYSVAHQRLYFGYSTGAIRYINPASASPAESLLTNLGATIYSLSSAGNFLAVQTGYYSYNSGRVLDSNGAIAASGGYYYGYSRETAWDPVNSRIYYFRDGISPGDLHYDVINQTTGQITASNETPYHGDYSFLGPIRVSANGQRVLVGEGNLFAQNGLTHSGWIGGRITDARWLADGTLVTLFSTNGQAALRHLSGSNFATLEQLPYTGDALRVVGTDSKMAVILNNGGAIEIHAYEPSDDTDGDGVLNDADAFPQDVAASTDSDRDGFPDAWNAGRSQADSTSGLALDAFAQDSACWLDAHGSGGACDVTATLPEYRPDQIVGGGDVVYLLSRENRRVYRWSIATEQYLNPYVVGNDQGYPTAAPTHIAYSGTHQRLYLGYETGAIRYIDVNAASPVEIPFTSLGSTVSRLTHAGNFLVAQGTGSYYAGNVSHAIDASGLSRDTGAAYFQTTDTAWDPVHSRLYHVSSGSTLFYEVLNQVTGEISAGGSSTGSSSYLRPPARVSVNGQRILLGSGDLFAMNGLAWSTSLGSVAVDTRWFADGSLLAFTTFANQSALRRLSGTNLTTLEQLAYTGEALRVLGSDTRMALVLFEDDTVRFEIYEPNNDSDGDGVQNTQDAFPHDRAASVDSDRDGYPDAWNAGRSQADSTTVPALTLDVFANDSACWLSSHGSGGVCNYGATVPAYTPDKIEHHGDIVYLLSNANRRVYRWSISSNSYVNPFVVGIDSGLGTIAPTTMAHSSTHQRLYLGYSNGEVRYIDLNGAATAEVPYTTFSAAINSLAHAGNFLLVQPYPFNSYGGYVVDSTGVIRDQGGYYYGYSRQTAWDPNFSRVYFYRDGISPNDLHYEVIDQTTGEITGSGETPYHGDYQFGGVVRVTQNGQYILTGGGDIFTRATPMSWSGSVGAPISDARWFANGSVVTLSTASNQTVLRRLGATNLAVQEHRSFTGEALRVVGSDTAMVVVVNNGGTVQFHRYEPNDDSDNDSVQNTVDAFPLDVAASVDSDRDGHPDAWNAGRTQSDSTTGLQLDAFPNDSACWLSTHATGGGTCNYGATVPNYLPDQVAQHNGVVYLLSAANRRVYRWSISAGAYINPYIVGMNQGFTNVAPTKLEYSANHQRLYLGYTSGAVRYLDANSSAPAETAFVTLSGPINRLTSADNFLVAHAGYYYSSTSSQVIDSSGVTRDTGGSYWSNYETAWDSTTSRMYYVPAGYNWLYYDEINQATGEFGASGSSPSSGISYLMPPARFSTDGTRLLLGSGDFLAQNDFTWLGSLGWQFTDARWFADGSLATLNQTGGLSTLHHLGSANLASLETRQYTGLPLRVLGSDTEMAVLVNNNGAVQLHRYVPSNDSDGDGVPNTSDAFPQDIAASVDTDGDNFPDAWNTGYDQDDSTTGLSLDSFPTEVACWAASHGSGGVCNYAATMPPLTPDRIEVHGDVVYLLASPYRRVYRWSIATGQYLRPYVVGGNAPYTSLAPTAMGYAPGHQRLYLGYQTGAIRYIDVNAATPVETPFTTLTQSVVSLAGAGNFLLAQPNGSYVGQVINSAGVTLDTSDYYYGYSRESAWDPVSSRAYFLSSGIMRYEVIDQTTGLIGATGVTPYSPQAFGGPIRVSADGLRIVLGNGNVYVRDGLVQTGSLGKTIVDAHWIGDILVTVDSTALVEIRDATSLAVLQTYQQLGSARRLVFGTSEAYLVHQLSDGTLSYWRLPFYDDDGDGIPRWWEQLYANGGAGMSDSDPTDATEDLDSDGINNLLEYQHHANPLVTDSDGDGLSDSLEILTHLTNPARTDTDGDGLSDHAEVVTHLTDPLDTDSDNDNFSDLIEVLYGGDPNQNGVLPTPLYNYSQTFENSPNLSAWVSPPLSVSPWALSTAASHAGSTSFRSGTVGNSQSSTVRFRGYLRPGQFSFWTRVDSGYCCNRLYVSLNGAQQLSINTGSQWYQYTVQIPAVGIHEIEWRFERDYYSGQPTDSAFIDDVVFVGQ